MTHFDARELRNTLGTFVTGVTVITTTDKDGIPYGLTANSFSSVSLDPPLILWSQSLNAPSHPVFRDAGHFCVSILADDQVEISNRFAKAGLNKFDGVPTVPGTSGIPLIEGSAATLECTTVASYPGGDHAVFLGRVDRLSRTDRRPLVFGSGKYLIAQPHNISAPPDAVAASIAELQAVRMATQLIVDLSDRLDETIGLGVWGNRGATIVRWEESSSPVSENLRTGLVLPLLKSATGLAFAAFQPREVTLSALVDEFAAEQFPDGAAGATLDAVADSLAGIRRSLIARLDNTTTFTEAYGGAINAASVPVFNRHGKVVLALTVIGAVDKLDTSDGSRVTTELREAARLLSAKLGYAVISA